MSFGFGSTSVFSSTTNTPAFGSTAAKPTGFGTPIMSATTSSAPAFGTTSTGFGFGASQPTSTGFGLGTGQPASTAFGQPASTGFGLGTGTSSTGFGLGTGASTTGFGLGTGQPASTGFGLGTGTTSTGFGGFGTTPASTGFGGFGGFGSTAATTTATGFGGFGSFGTTSATAPSTGFSFGAPVSSAAAGTTPWGGTGFSSAYGQPAGMFGQKPAGSFGVGGSLFGAPQQQLQPQPVDPSVAFYESIMNCQVFGDERDDTLRRWNLLQALYGFGKGFHSQQAPPVEYDLKNPFCRFKAMAYSVRPTVENKDGRVALIFNKKENEIRALESQIVTNLANILGNKPNLSPTVESIRAMSDTKTVVVVSVQEKAANGTVRKVPALELAGFLHQATPKQQLTSLQVENVYAQVEPSAEQLREYLDTPPAGIDPQTWQQAQDDNPFPDRLIPVPVVGFSEVRWRMKCQETEAGLQQAFLDKMAEEMADLQRKHTSTVANIVEYKSRLVELQHRILKVVILQEKSRKMGMSLLPEEEALNSRLESLSATLNSSWFKNRLSALKEGVKSLEDNNKEPQRYKMDPSVISDIKQFLNMSQSGISHMIETIQSDLSELKIVKDGMVRLLQRPV